MEKMRLERDSIGEKEVPENALYGVHSLRALENFSISSQRMHPEMVKSLAILKKACAAANLRAGMLPRDKAEAIIWACDRIAAGDYRDQFIVDPMQGGAGTSMNMNANEVIANAAILHLGGRPGDYGLIHPNDHVNCGQSTNDVIPTAGKMTLLTLLRRLEAALDSLICSLDRKAEAFDPILKMGRTQLQDAVPVRLGQEFQAYATAVRRGRARIHHAGHELLNINMGGTAIGTGLNAHETYFTEVTKILSQHMNAQFRQAGDLIDSTQNVDCYAAISGALRNCALALSKIANDLRLMSSGPRTGFGEINLPPRQNGSSIMPGKVNPVIPEVVNQIAFLVAGNDLTVSMAVEAGQMELNAFEPVIFRCLIQSIQELTQGVLTFTCNCVEDITANEDRCRELLQGSVGTVTALCPYIGYSRAAALAKQALKEHTSVRDLALRQNLMTEAQLSQVLNADAMTHPGIPGRDA